MSSVARPESARSEVVGLKDKLKAAGPGAIVAAGIVGPGTVTTFTVAGADFRYAPLWIILVAALVTYVFQAPAVRLAAVSDHTLMQITRSHISKITAVVMFGAAFIGAIAFQAGNFVGAGMAMNYLVPGLSITVWATIATAIALAIMWIGVYKLLENLMTAIIVLMVIAFVITAIGSTPPAGDIVGEGFEFSTLGGDWMLIGALIATTVPPTAVLAYSTFLRKKRAREVVSPERKLKFGLFDLRVNVVFVGLIAAAIIVTSATVINPRDVTVESAADMAEQLTPVLGRYAGVLFALGLFAAGISSGLYHASLQPSLLSESLGREDQPRSNLSRALAVVVLVVPLAFVWIFGNAPVQLIVTAQAVNAVVLPLVVIVMAMLARRADVFGPQRYSGLRYLALILVAGLTVALGVRVFIGFFM